MQTSTPQWESSTVLTTTVICTHRFRANPDAWLVSVLFYFKDIYAHFLSHKDAFYFAKEPKHFISCLRFCSTSDF